MPLPLPPLPSLSETEMRQALAVGLVHLGLRTMSEASNLAGMDEEAFARLFHGGAAAGDYDLAALEEDLATLAQGEAP